MQLQSQNTIPPYLIYSNQQYFYLKCTLEHLKNPNFIRIEKDSCKIQNLQPKQFNEGIKQIKPIPAMLIVGILILNTQIYLLFVSTASIVFKQSKNDEIYQVQNVIHYPFTSPIQYKNCKYKKVNEQTLKYLQQTIFKKNFYFRYRTDITLSLQNSKMYNKSTQYKFFWNQHMVRIFKQNNTHKCWRIPIMQGYIKCQTFSKDSYYLMISRRSKIFSGPRLFNRGIYEVDGQSVANFVQTQQIYKFKNDYFSYVSLRGSVPVYWKQNKGFMEFKNDQKNPIGFQNHLLSLQKAYPQKRVYFISWLMRQKQQLLLKEKLDICFYHSKQKYHQNDKYRMISIDLDQNNKNALFFLKQLIHKQISSLMPYKDNFFWYTQEKGQQIVMGKQKLIYRVNCLDCTMRSNAVLTELSRKTMRDIQQILSIKKDSNQHYEGLEEIVTNRWKQLGMRISRLYCGQDELQIGKKQQSSFFSMFSLNKDPMGSQYKQKSLQQLLNQVTPKQVVSIQRNLQRKLNITQFCQINKLKIFIISWNCNNLNPLTINQLNKQMLFNFNRGKIDIVVFNLQQMVQLSTYNVLVTIDQEVKNKWKQIISETLNQKINNEEEKFDFVAQQNLVAITTWIFIKRRVKVKNYQAKQSTIVKTGFANGLGGNKGAVMIFLKFDSTWISFVNCHLTAGQGKKFQRKQSLQLILYSWIEQKFKDILQLSEIIFLIGDLNFRLQWTQQQIKSVLYEVQKKFNKQSLKMGLKGDTQNAAVVNSLKALWEKDELIAYQKSNDQILSKFKQKPLVFMPTYKYIKKTHVNEYDDKRSPAWCDRILYQQKVKNLIDQLFYQDIDINLSDHKPVTGLFQVKIKKVIEKEGYLKAFNAAKSMYYKNQKTGSQKSNLQQPQENYKEKIPNLEQIDFFAQNINKNSPKKDEYLLDLDHKQDADKGNFGLLIQFENQKNNFSIEKSHANNKNNQLSRSGQSNGSAGKNDFFQFHQIAAQIQRKSNQGSKSQSQNLIDLQ